MGQIQRSAVAVRYPGTVALVRGSILHATADRLAALAARAANAPTSLVQLADGPKLLLTGACGLPAAWEQLQEASTSTTLAGLVFATGLPVVVENVDDDPRVPADAPVRLVGAQSYAGFPVRDPGGEVVGVCCVLDYRPRAWTAGELSAVDDAAQACTCFVAERYARDEADRHRSFLDGVLDNLNDGVAACDDSGRMILVNAAMRAISGVPPEEFRAGQANPKFVVYDAEGRVLAPDEYPLTRALRGESFSDTEIVLDGPDGRTRHVLMEGQPVSDGSDRPLGAVVTAHDVTARWRANRFGACELAVSTALADSTSAQQAGPEVLRAVGTTLGWAHAELWLVDEGARVLRPAARWSPPGPAMDMPVPDTIGFGSGLAGGAWKNGGPLWVRDIGQPQGPMSFSVAGTSGLRSALAVPVSSGRQTLGVMCLFADVVEDPEDSLVSLLSGVAAHVGQFLERRRAEDLQLQLARTKDEYVALVGHELRTPITSIGAYTEMLLETDPAKLATDAPAMLAVIDRNTARLRRVVDELLDIAALDTGHATINMRPCDLTALITEAVQQVRPALRTASTTITVDLPGTLPVNGDSRRLRQVIDNLLANAIKYSPDGGRISVTAGQVDGHSVQFTVTDTGIGIPVKDREHLFERFYRSSNAYARGIPGTGLGLATSRAIVERHHGTIGLVPEVEDQTAMRVRLPIGGGTRGA